jgi:flagellar basal body P-ring protein FlgI
VTINRTTKNVSFTASVKISPTVLQIPGVGTLRIGAAESGEGKPDAKADAKPAVTGEVSFDELFATLAAIKVSPDQLIDAIEQLHETGALHAQLQYK